MTVYLWSLLASSWINMADNQYNRDTFEVSGRHGVFEAVDAMRKHG